MAATPIRGLRVPDDEWARWQAEADGAGVSVTAWVRHRCLPAEHHDEYEPQPVELAPTNDQLAAANRARPEILEPPVEAEPCRHPKRFRDVKPYATMCSKELGGCGARL
jgi:hypothetical protein